MVTDNRSTMAYLCAIDFLYVTQKLGILQNRESITEAWHDLHCRLISDILDEMEDADKE